MKMLSRKIVMGCGVAAAALLMAGGAVAQQRIFDVPSQEAVKAIPLFARQAGVQIIAPAGQLRGVRTPTLQGNLETHQALITLLQGTGLEVASDNGTVIVLRRIPTGASLQKGQGLVPGASIDGPVASPVTIDELVVTAQRRAERLQDVPVAITAMTQAALDRQHIVGVRDLARVTPSLSFTEPSPGQAVISLRGLTTESQLSPVVGYYFDETPFELRSDMYAGVPALEFFDVQRVEVLRGPQGTLFGAGAMGGAIRIITNKPDPSRVEGQFEQELAFTDGGAPSYLVRGAFNQPISDNLAVRLVGTYRRSGGYIDGAVPTNYYDRAPTPPIAAHDENSAEAYSGRIAVRWDAAPGLAVTPSLIYQRIDANGLNYYDSVTTNRVNYRLFPGSFTDKLVIANLLVEKDLGFASFISSTSYLNKVGSSLTDYSGTAANLDNLFTGETVTQPLFPTVNSRPTDYRQTTQEFRLTSKTGGWLRWTVGAYYDYTAETSGQLVTSPSLGAVISNIFGVSPADPVLVDFNGWNSDNQIAGFGEVTVTPVRGVEITAGLRAYRLKQAVYQDVEGLLGSGPTPVDRSNAQGLNPKFVISYKPDRDFTAYLTAAKGFRAGGPNGVLLGAGCTLMDVYHDTYEPDSVWNYEAGVKKQFWDGRASANLAAYRINWNNIQGEVDSSCGAFEANIGTARINGAEAEFTLRPTDSLSLSGTFSYNDAKLESLKPGFESGVLIAPGDRIVNVPRLQYSFSGEYAPEVDWRFKPYIDLNYQHVGSTPTNYEFTSAAYFRPGYDNVDLNIGVRTDRLDGSIFVRNLTNAVQIVDIQHSSVGQALYNLGRPLTVGVNLKERF